MSSRTRFRKLAFAGAGALLLGVIASPLAEAASVSFYMNQTNINLAPFTDGTNYLKVTIDDNGAPGDINFTVTALPALTNYAGSNFGLQAFNFNSSLCSGTGSGTSCPPTTFSLPSGWSSTVAPPPQTGDGFGQFDYQVNNGGGARLTTLSFTISGVSGDTLTTYSSILSSGSATEGNSIFAAHVGGFTTNASGVTGGWFGGAVPVPLPAAGWLFGSGLIGLVGVARRLRART